MRYMSLNDLMCYVLYNQRIQVEFKEGIVFGTAQVLLKVLDSDKLDLNIQSVSAKDNCLMVVVES